MIPPQAFDILSSIERAALREGRPVHLSEALPILDEADYRDVARVARWLWEHGYVDSVERGAVVRYMPTGRKRVAA